MLNTHDSIIVTLLLFSFLGVPASADSAQLRQMEYEFITNHDYKIPRGDDVALLIVESPIEGLLFDTTNRIIGTSYPHPGIYELRLATGRHVLTISVEGYVTLQGIRLTLQPKQVSALRVIPKPSAPARFDPEGRRIKGGESDWDPQILPQHVVTFETDPSGAEVRIAGEYRCATPCNRELQEGTHQITLRLSRYAEIEETITVSEPLTLRRELTPLFGWITVRTEPPGLEVQLNGQQIGTSPVVRYELDPGRHTVMVADPRYYEAGVEGFEISGNEHREFEVFRPVAREGALTVRAVTADARKEPLARPVQIGGRAVGQTPWSGRLLVGRHRVTVGGQAREVEVFERKEREEVFEVAVAAAPAHAGLVEMVRIPAGTYQRGSPASEEGRIDRETQHTVTISQPFFMATTEVTQALWQRVMGGNLSYFKGEDLPVETVSWFDAVWFCNKLSELEGFQPAYRIQSLDVTWDRGANGYRLPTEAEWEYACRAGTTTRYHTGDSESDLGRAGWYIGNSGSKTHPVGRKQANAWGLYDMHGNVWEWCWDWYGRYPSGQASDPVGPTSSSNRVLRGGSWSSYAQYCRSASRTNDTPANVGGSDGLRLVRRAL